MRAPDPTPRFLRPALAVPALGLAFLLLYLLTLQPILYGDGVLYLTIVRDTLQGTLNPVGHHPLYPPLLVGAARLGRLLGLDLIRSGALFSALTGAAGVALSYVLLRAWTSRPRLALFGALLLGLAPTTWFFSTTTENHSLHFFCMVLLYLGLTHATRARSLAWLLLPGLLYVPAFLSHTTALMLAPFLAAACLILRRPDPGAHPVRRTLLALGLLLGPVLLARLCLPALYTWINQGVDPFHGLDPTAATLQADVFPRAGLKPGLAAWLWENPLRLAGYTLRNAPGMALYVAEDWLFHSGLAGLLFLLGALLLLARGRPGWPLAGLLALLPYAWLFSFWGFRPVEKGAYYLHLLPPTLAIGLLGLAHLRPRRLLVLSALLLLGAQAALAGHVLLDHRRSDTRQEWARQAASLVRPPGAPLGVILTGDDYRCAYLRFFHPSQAGAFRLADLAAQDPAGLLHTIHEYRSWNARLFADQPFFDRAAHERPDLAGALATLPWKNIDQGLLRGRALGAP